MSQTKRRLQALLPAQGSQLAGAAPGVVGQGEVGDGAQLQAFGQRPQSVVVQVQRLDGRHTGKRTIRELEEGSARPELC